MQRPTAMATSAFTTRLALLVLLSIAGAVDALTQMYCSNENTGSDYSSSELGRRIPLRARLSSPLLDTDSRFQPSAQVNPMASATISAPVNTPLPWSSGNRAGAQITLPRIRPTSRTAVKHVRVIHTNRAATRIKASTATSLSLGVLPAPLGEVPALLPSRARRSW